MSDMAQHGRVDSLPSSPPAQRVPAADATDQVDGVSSRHQLADAVSAEELFEPAFERAPIGMALVAPDGRWLRVNAALCELTGRSEFNLLAGSFQDITHPEDLEPDLALLGMVLSGVSEGYRIEKRYIRPDGQHVWVLLAVSLVRDSAGKPKLCISQMVDITDRKQAEAQLLHAANHDSLTGLCSRARFS